MKIFQKYEEYQKNIVDYLVKNFPNCMALEGTSANARVEFYCGEVQPPLLRDTSKDMWVPSNSLNQYGIKVMDLARPQDFNDLIDWYTKHLAPILQFSDIIDPYSIVHSKEVLPPEIKNIDLLGNVQDLCARVNKFIFLSNTPREIKVTSGFRTLQQHLEIYKKKGITDLSKIPMHSKHLSGQAVDLADFSEVLKGQAILNDNAILKACGLYMEHRDATCSTWTNSILTRSGWIHLQSVPPASGNYEFHP